MLSGVDSMESDWVLFIDGSISYAPKLAIIFRNWPVGSIALPIQSRM